MIAATSRPTANEVLLAARAALRPSRTAALDAELLLAHVLRINRVEVLTHGERCVSEAQLDEYQQLLARRQQAEPVAYLRGFVEWYGLKLEVTHDVLIPRPETELVLDRALQMAVELGAETIADIGTGSGAIAAALATRLPAIEVWAVDSSVASLEVASRNVARLDVCQRVRLLAGDLLEPLPEEPDMIVGNLPYLSVLRLESLPDDVRHEPRSALDGGEDGLELVARLLTQFRSNRWRCPLVLEMDAEQQRGLQCLVASVLPQAGLQFFRDYAQNPRIGIICHDRRP